MKASCVDVLLTATFRGVADIITGKSWTNALRANRLITTMFLQDFFQSGAKTYQELREYMDRAVRDHPVGRLWVDCLIKPLFSPCSYCMDRVSDFLLQQVSLKAMIPYIFAAAQ